MITALHLFEYNNCINKSNVWYVFATSFYTLFFISVKHAAEYYSFYNYLNHKKVQNKNLSYNIIGHTCIQIIPIFSDMWENYSLRSCLKSICIFGIMYNNNSCPVEGELLWPINQLKSYYLLLSKESRISLISLFQIIIIGKKIAVFLSYSINLLKLKWYIIIRKSSNLVWYMIFWFMRCVAWIRNAKYLVQK